MKKILITTVLFLMMLSLPVMAGTYSRSSKSNGTCIVSGCSRSQCDRCFYCSGHKCVDSSCKNKRASDSVFCSKHKSKTNSSRKNSGSGSSYRSKSKSSSKSSFDPDDHDIESYYDDYRDEYDDYDDAYDGFCDDDAWDDY